MISIGDRLPHMDVVLADAGGPKPTTTTALFAGHRAVLFGVPGAFTPTCSERHLPGFVDHLDALHAKGIDPVICLAVNDPFVLAAWARQTGAAGLLMLSDGSGLLTAALGLQLDLTSRGFGVRAQRFAAVVDDMTLTHLAIESQGSYGVSSAEHVLQAV